MNNEIAFTFTHPKSGEEYRVGPYSSWTTINGIEITNARVHVVDKNSGHGWGGVMKKEQIEAAMKGEGF